MAVADLRNGRLLALRKDLRKDLLRLRVGEVRPYSLLFRRSAVGIEMVEGTREGVLDTLYAKTDEWIDLGDELRNSRCKGSSRDEAATLSLVPSTGGADSKIIQHFTWVYNL